MKQIKLKVLSLVFASLLLVSCNRQEEQPAQKPSTPKPPEPPKPVSMLTLVPEDTILFSGGTEPIPLKDWLVWNASRFNVSKNTQASLLKPQELDKIKEKATTDGQRMAIAIWEDYVSTATEPAAQFQNWGVADTPMLAIYAIGLAPVVRISLNDAQRFTSKLAALEEKAKIKTEPVSLGQANYRRYPLTAKKEGQDLPQVSLIIGVDGKDAVFLLDVGIDSEKTLALALGQSKPEKSLEQSGRIKSLQAQYKFSFPWLGYLDHRQFITGLTTKDGNAMAKMVQQLAAKLKPEDTAWLADLQSEGCRNDFSAIGANWPQTVSGYTAVDLKGKPARMDSVMVIESKDKPLLDGLASLRGFTPDYGSPAFASTVISGGIGLSVENIGPFLMKQWTEITQKPYQCAPLKAMQEQLKGNNPAAASMATSMAAGVRGLSFSLLSLTLEQQPAGAPSTTPPMPKAADALISLSAKDPAALLQTVSGLLPQLAELKIPADGTPVALPAPVPLPFPLMAAVNGQHLTVYAGEKAGQLAKELGKMPLESSQGILSGAFDYGKFYSLLADALPKNDAKAAEAGAALEALKDAKLRIEMKLDFTERGIEMKANMVSTD
ncbi:hypothetical protein [Candidatus Electronema sp. JM]|uniref:hypothetical protein n=1 Tax=Candidatus Electronema sp. JM TaxID=3401571 RepID=UPI003AA82883